MGKYNIFDEAIPSENKRQYKEDLAERKSILDASNLIAEALEESKMSQTEFAVKAKVSKGYISRVLSGHENLTVKSLARLLHVLGKDYHQSIENQKTNVTDMYTYKKNKITGIMVPQLHSKVV